MKLDAIKLAMADGDLPQNVNFAVKSAMVAAFLHANRVAYKAGVPGGTAMQPADIADQARAMSGFVMCGKAECNLVLYYGVFSRKNID